jgi:putative ABC transport system permease protein
MNPLPLVTAMLRRDFTTGAVFVALIALAVGIAAAITAQERALRSGSARAADKFDLIVAAPGSQTDLLLKVVFLQPGSVELLSGPPLRRLLSEDRATFIAPIGFGDSFEGTPVVGTIPDFVDHLSGGQLIEGRMFAERTEVVVGAASPLEIGQAFHASHGHGAEALPGDHHPQELRVVGRMAPTGSPWDRALLVPIEFVWAVHGLPDGHTASAGGQHDGDHVEQIGPPFDPDRLPGIPAAVVKPATIADAYGLRSAWRTSESMAFFPAEVLVALYELLGDVRVVMTALAIASQILLVGAVLAGILILMRLYRHRFAILRALGASRLYVFLVAWLFGFVLVAVGSALGLAVATAMTLIVSRVFERASGIALHAGIGVHEVAFAIAVAGLGAVLAAVPGVLVYRRPVVDGLRST